MIKQEFTDKFPVHFYGKVNFYLFFYFLVTIVWMITRWTRDRQPSPSLKEVRAHRDGSMAKTETHTHTNTHTLQSDNNSNNEETKVYIAL